MARRPPGTIKRETPEILEAPRQLPDGTWRVSFRTSVDEWYVSGWVSFRQGEALHIRELTVAYSPLNRPRSPSKGSGWAPIRDSSRANITGEVLSWIHPSILAEEIRKVLLIEYEVDDLLGQFFGTRFRPGSRKALHPKPVPERGRPGRKPIPSDQLERLAREAIRLSNKGVRPLRPALAETFNVSIETIRDWLHKAREQGWLGPWTPGQKQQLPGPKLLAKEERSK